MQRPIVITTFRQVLASGHAVSAWCWACKRHHRFKAPELRLDRSFIGAVFECSICGLRVSGSSSWIGAGFAGVDAVTMKVTETSQ